MFSNKIKPQFFLLKKIAAAAQNPLKGKPTIPIIPCRYLFKKSLKNFFSKYSIPMYQFSSIHQNLRHTDYKKDLALLENYPQEKLLSLIELMEKYSQCQDLSLLSSDEAQMISFALWRLAGSCYAQGDRNKAISYAKENEQFCKKVGISDTFNLAQTYLIHAGALVDLANFQSIQTIGYYLNEVDRICQLLGEDKDAKSVRLQAWSQLIMIEIMNHRPDKGLEIANSILQRLEDVNEMALPSVLICVYRGMGFIYKFRSETGKMIEARKKGLEIALKHFGESSSLAFEFSNQLAEYHYLNQPQKALPYVKQQLEIASKVFPKDSKEVADSYFMLGNLYESHEDYAEALASFEEALKFYERSPQANLEALSAIYLKCIGIYGLRHDFKGAENLLPKVELLKSLKPQNYAAIFKLYHGLGHIALDGKDFNKAYKMYKECERIRDETQVDLSKTTRDNTQFNLPTDQGLNADLSVVCTALGKTDEAEKYTQKLLQFAYSQRIPGPMYQILADGYEKRGLLREALVLFKKAIEEYANMGESMNDPAIVKLFARMSGIESKLRVANQ